LALERLAEVHEVVPVQDGAWNVLLGGGILHARPVAGLPRLPGQRGQVFRVRPARQSALPGRASSDRRGGADRARRDLERLAQRRPERDARRLLQQRLWLRAVPGQEREPSMKRRDDPRTSTTRAHGEAVASVGFKSLAELRAVIRIYSELSDTVGIPLPKSLRREKPNKTGSNR
jgi:hypothetical protein